MAYKLIFFVPKKDAEQVKDAVFSTGAGTMGNYSQCSFETEGVGQFLPLAKSNPHLGDVHKLTKVVELKVEILCPENVVKEAVYALKKAHPYEEVAYEVIKIEKI